MALERCAPEAPEARRSSTPGPHARPEEPAGKSRGQTKDRTSGVAGHAAVAATGLPPPPRSGAQGRRQRLMTRSAAAEVPPDSQPGPQTPRRTRTLKRSLRRHAQLARRPPAPLLSGLLDAHAQCCQSPPLRTQRACACVRPGSAEVPAQAQMGVACRPPPLPHSKKASRGRLQIATCLHAAPPQRPKGSLHRGALTLSTLSLCCVTASSDCPKTPQPTARNHQGTATT